MDSRRRTPIAIALLAGAAVFGAALADDAAPPRTLASLSGTFRSDKGKPIAGAVVSIEGGGTTKTAADGTWTIAPVVPGDALVTAKGAGFRVQTLLRVAAGEKRVWDATIGKPGVLTGRLLDEYGNPLARQPGWAKDQGWLVAAECEQEWMNRPDSEDWSCLTDENGNFRLRVSLDALFRLRVIRTDKRWLLALRTEWISGGLADITLRALPADMPHARVFCRIEDRHGAAVTGDGAPEEWVYLHRVDEAGIRHFHYGRRLTFDAVKGAWVSDPLSLGRYAVVASISDWDVFEFPAVDVRDAADVDIGTLRLPPQGRARFVPARTGPGGDAPVKLSLACIGTYAGRDLPSSPWWWGGWCLGFAGGPELTGDAPVEQGLCPGRWSAHFSAIDPVRSKFEYAEVPFEVRSGETTTVTIPVRGAPVRTIRVGLAGRTPSQAVVAVSDASGVVVGRSVPLAAGAQEFQTCLAPGRHTLVALTSDRRRLTGTLDIPEKDAPEKFDVFLR
jgi:carboxypeptidase family protein